MSNARGCLKQIQEYGITKYWTGCSNVWDVPTLDHESCCSNLVFASEAAAQSYVDALNAVVAAEQATITPSKEAIEELDRIGCEKFWAKVRDEECWAKVCEKIEGVKHRKASDDESERVRNPVL